jgi:acetyl-CoA acetyltransferase
MSNFDMMGQVDPSKLSEEAFSNEQSQKCLMGMGQTSENVAEKYGITREK